MKDYKHIAQSLKRLKQEIEVSFKEVHKTQTSHKNNFIEKFSRGRFLLPLSGVIIACVLFLSIRGLVHAHEQGKKLSSAGMSFLGSRMLDGEFQNMENPEAIGGGEIGQYDKEQPELKFFFYKVKQGENISSISKKLGLNMDTLVSLNSMENAHSIAVGSRILVPNVPGILYTVKNGDNIDKISKAYGIQIADVLDANDKVDPEIREGDILFLPGAQLSAKERAKAFGYLFSKPIRGRYTSGFGIRFHPIYKRKKFHTGIDIAAPIGSVVKSAKEGRVIFAGWNGGYGKCVIIKHQLGYETVYGHMSKISVSVGQYVKQGQMVGRVGSTGVSTGPHLHFEVRKYGQVTNPLKYTGLGKSGGWY